MGVEDADLVSQFGDYPMLVFVAQWSGLSVHWHRVDWICAGTTSPRRPTTNRNSVFLRELDTQGLPYAGLRRKSAKGAAEARLRSACRPNNITSASARRRSFFGSELRTNSAKLKGGVPVSVPESAAVPEGARGAAILRRRGSDCARCCPRRSGRLAPGGGAA